tara:strand:- start:13445 stop:14296 length:852 start_codon:yes stop_codon:yes gene_type:complete
MKILAIGDFHGKFPVKLQKLVKKEKIDLIVSTGDYTPFSLRDVFFKHCYGTDVELWEPVGKTKYKKIIKKDENKAELVIKKLNKIGVPVVSVLGNIDYPMADDVEDIKKPLKEKFWNWDWKRIKHVQNIIKKYKNIKYIDYKSIKIEGLIFIGMRGHSHPGSVKSKSFKKHRKILDNLFKKYKNENKIFISHMTPFDNKLDIITSKKADKRAKGRHFGSKLARRIINKYQPVLSFSGHFHENQGKCKIGNTIVINPGAAVNGKAAIIDFNEEKGKVVSVKFVK